MVRYNYNNVVNKGSLAQRKKYKNRVLHEICPTSDAQSMESAETKFSLVWGMYGAMAS